MRAIDSIKKEFDSDFDNPRLSNDTLKVKYITSIIGKEKQGEIPEDITKELETLEEEFNTRIDARDDFVNNFQEKITKLQEDIMKGFRIVDTSRGEVIVRFPSLLDDEAIEFECSKFYGELFGQGDLLSEREILNLLEKKGIWNKEQEEKLEKLMEYFKDSYYKLTSEQLKTVSTAKGKPNSKKIAELTKEVSDLEKQFNELNVIKTKHMQNSIESRIEERRMRLKLIKCTFKVKETEDKKETGEPVWPSVEELKNDSRTYIMEVFRLASAYWSGFDPSFLRV